MSNSNFNPFNFISKKFRENKKFWQAAEKSLTREKKKEEIKESIKSYKTKIIEAYFRRLSEIFEEKDQYRKKRKLDALKRLIFKRFIIKKENIPKSYIQQEVENLKKIYPERTEEIVIDRLIQSQKQSLEVWIDYLISQIEHYPKELLYWVFNEVLKLGSYNYEKKIFNQRSKNTISNFPPLNAQALAIVLEQLIRKFFNKPPSLILPLSQKRNFLENLERENFNELYCWSLEYIRSLREEKELLPITSGQWKLFSIQNNLDSLSSQELLTKTKNDLIESLKIFKTGWCIDQPSAALNYLASNNILIYFSNDIEGKPTIPRLVIIYNSPSATSKIVDETTIFEIRGISENQNLDPYILEILEKKLKEFPKNTRLKYQPILEDIKMLNEIWFKFLNGQELTIQELRFIYEIDKKIGYFGYYKDERIKEILSHRDKRKDLSLIFNCKPWEIALTTQEALQGKSKIYVGSLDLSDKLTLEEINLPTYLYGDLLLNNLRSAKNLVLPKTVKGDLNLFKLQSLKEVKLPDEIYGSLYLDFLSSSEGLILPSFIKGELLMPRISEIKNFTFPSEIGGNLDIRSLQKAENVIFPEKIGGSLNLASLNLAKNIILPKSIEGLALGLNSLKKGENIQLPSYIKGNLSLISLKTLECLNFPLNFNVEGEIFVKNLPDQEIEDLKTKYPHLKIRKTI